MNKLANSSSSYLRSAAHQPIDWHPWGEKALALAAAQQKPILLDSGAVWCHWCHVMDRESYEDPEIAQIINANYIAIKVDRDERPDVDARYQAAVSAISGQGGWPLTAFLAHDGRPYFGGTYFPRHERFGRPGFDRVLLTMAAVWRDRRDEALDSAASVMAAIEENENFSGSGGALNFALTEKIATATLKQFDPRNGGFGSQPKFPHPAAIDLLLQIAERKSATEPALAAQLLHAAECTLLKMGRGGVYDHLAGGFHRYSVDERWIVPHFEKMLYDNTELLRNYLHAARNLIGASAEEAATLAREIILWLDSTMTDRTHGGFYGSQDADINLDDDGDYFTWTEHEANAALANDPDALAFAKDYWDIGPLGDMHHNSAKNVLHTKRTLSEIATATNQPLAELTALRNRARMQLLEARFLRPTPFIDRTLYTNWNAMAVSAYLDAAQGLGNTAHNFTADEKTALKDFALKTLDRILSTCFVEAPDGNSTLAHVITYSADSAEIATQKKIPGLLDDYAFTLHAALDAYTATGNARYYQTAESLAAALLKKFFYHDALDSGAFADSDQTTEKIGALTARRRPLQDSPTPAGNPVAASALLRLAELNYNSEYRVIAMETLQSFSGIVEHFGLYVGSYALALERLLAMPEQLMIFSGSSPADITLADLMASAAASPFHIGRTILRLNSESLDALPPALAETIGQMPAREGTWAILCKNHTCLPPITSLDDLKAALN